MDACQKAGLPAPILEEYAGGFQITFLKNIYTEEHLRSLDLNERQIKAVLYTKEHGQITNAIYQQLNDIKQTVSSQELQDLVKKEILLPTGNKGRGAKYSLVVSQG